MFDWLPNTQNTITVTNGANTANVTLNNRWLTTVTGKLGYAWGSFPVLLYGKGGGACPNFVELAMSGFASMY
jgi:hypothetical protein